MVEYWLTLEEAANITGLEMSLLINLCQTGKIAYGKLLPNEDLIMERNSLLMAIPRENQPEYIAVAHLAGKAISMRAASKEYGVPHQTISRWVDRGIIKVLGHDGRKILIDRADIAYCATIYQESREAGSTRGKWLFTDSGTPYKKQD